MKSDYFPVGRKGGIVSQELGNELMIYDLDANKAICLNETSSQVWGLCDGTHTPTDIAGELRNKHNSGINEEFVWLALDGLKKAKMLEESEIAFAPPAGFSRREAIKRAGLASMIALPMISMIAAPSALSAQSTCIPNGQISSGTFPFPDFNELSCLSALRARCCAGDGIFADCPCSFTTYTCSGSVTCQVQ